MRTSDLLGLLIDIARKDLTKGSKIEDHPCFIASQKIIDLHKKLLHKNQLNLEMGEKLLENLATDLDKIARTHTKPKPTIVPIK